MQNLYYIISYKQSYNIPHASFGVMQSDLKSHNLKLSIW